MKKNTNNLFLYFILLGTLSAPMSHNAVYAMEEESKDNRQMPDSTDQSEVEIIDTSSKKSDQETSLLTQMQELLHEDTMLNLLNNNEDFNLQNATSYEDIVTKNSAAMTDAMTSVIEKHSNNTETFKSELKNPLDSYLNAFINNLKSVMMVEEMQDALQGVSAKKHQQFTNGNETQKSHLDQLVAFHNQLKEKGLVGETSNDTIKNLRKDNEKLYDLCITTIKNAVQAKTQEIKTLAHLIKNTTNYVKNSLNITDSATLAEIFITGQKAMTIVKEEESWIKKTAPYISYTSQLYLYKKSITKTDNALEKRKGLLESDFEQLSAERSEAVNEAKEAIEAITGSLTKTVSNVLTGAKNMATSTMDWLKGRWNQNNQPNNNQ